MPRRTISSANSRWLHWLIGRSESAGFSHARAIIWHTCSGVNFAGAPSRGGIGQPLRHAEIIHGYLSKLQPALPPEARRLVIQSEPPRDLRIVPPIASREDDPSARHQLLTSRVGTHQALQIHSLALTQHNVRGSQ